MDRSRELFNTEFNKSSHDKEFRNFLVSAAVEVLNSFCSFLDLKGFLRKYFRSYNNYLKAPYKLVRKRKSYK